MKVLSDLSLDKPSFIAGHCLHEATNILQFMQAGFLPKLFHFQNSWLLSRANCQAGFRTKWLDIVMAQVVGIFSFNFLKKNYSLILKARFSKNRLHTMQRGILGGQECLLSQP